MKWVGTLRRCLAGLAIGAALAALVVGCTTAPLTGRDQLVLISDTQATQLGLQAYQQILSQKRVSRNPAYNQAVQRVGRRIIAVSDQPDLPWEFRVIEDDTPNAFTLPGGKVGVHTGLFKVAQNESQLAAVMGHEIGHAIARHSAERMSQQILAQTGLQVLGATTEDASTVQLAAAAATLGVILPYSRTQEAEADHIGLIYMARAGYDPREAVQLWRNFQTYGGDRPPEFLSTHPAPASRIQRLEALMPEAMAIYQSNRGQPF